MIEARWLFGVPMEQVDVVVHPQSIVHSLVEFVDGSQLAQLSHSDMCFPIQYAVTYPDRLPNRLRPLNLAEMGALHFEAPDPERFPRPPLAREAGTAGGTLPAVLNAANEIAVPAFLEGKNFLPRHLAHGRGGDETALHGGASPSRRHPQGRRLGPRRRRRGSRAPPKIIKFCHPELVEGSAPEIPTVSVNVKITGG